MFRIFVFENVPENKCAVLRSRHPNDRPVAHLVVLLDLATKMVVSLFLYFAPFFVFVRFVDVRLLFLVSHLRPVTGDRAEDFALLGLSGHAGTHFVETEIDRET